MRTLLDNVTVTGAGQGQYLVEARPSNVFNQHGVQVVTTAGAAAVTVDLEGSLDGKLWAQLAQHVMSAPELAVGHALFFTNLSPVEYVRASVIVNTDASPVTVLYSGVQGA